MRFLLPLLALFVICSCKNNVKSLTESMGQEVIEIGTPIKELPPELEEEPSVENEEEDKSTSTTIQAGTKKDIKKTTTVTTAVDGRRKNKEVEKNSISEKEKSDEEEARIEKELAEIYKDSIDYKGDSSEMGKEEKNVTDKPALRARTNFKFQPDVQNKKEIERFRTSVDEISCGRINKLVATTITPDKGNMAVKINHVPTMVLLSFIAAFTFLSH